MQLTDKIFKGLYRRGVMLEQMKEPALSRTVKQLLPVEPCENPRDCEGLSAEEILLAAQQADIVDETDGRPLAEKLREVMGSGAALLIDAIDDEPYVSSQMGPMLALRDQCAAGIRLAARVLGTADTAILVYKHVHDSEVSIPRHIAGIPIQRVGGKYPAQRRMEEELADVMIYCVMLADRLGVDPVEAMRRKLEQNARKYPVGKARGRSSKYTEL